MSVRAKSRKWTEKILVVFTGIVLILTTILAGCGGSGSQSDKDGSSSGQVQELGSGSKQIRILSGSENKELTPILEDYAKRNHVRITMTYEGSLDIMRALGEEEFDYDAVWPASSIWMNSGDKLHRVKHAESISMNPVVFGIRKSLAEKLGFVGEKVSVRDILDAIQAGKLKFCMTSATQSNSGASAYIGFIHALSGSPDVITSDTLKDQDMRKNLMEIMSGIDRSSGSSDWLKDMFVAGDYDAMVNYECLMIAANQELEKAGKEPLYVVYPYDGLSIADSPLGYVDQGDDKEEQLFLDFQDYLLSSEVQDRIQKTGRRTGYTGISDENKDVFRSEWGLQPDLVLSPFKMPEGSVLDECLNLYQNELRKPSLTVYCLDFSGSMYGEGEDQLKAAMKELLVQENARKNYLGASAEDVTILIPFNEEAGEVYNAEGNGSEMDQLYDVVENLEPDGGTDMYAAMEKGLEEMKKYDLSRYTAAIIVMTDGMSEDHYDEFEEAYQAEKQDIPVFSLMYGDADSDQLNKLAELSNARVFDGREDLVGAFRKVRGYN